MEKVVTDEVADASPRLGLLPAVLRNCARLLTLVAVGLWGLAIAAFQVGYVQLSNARVAAMGLHHCPIEVVYVGPRRTYGGNNRWVMPPPTLERKLKAALNAPRLPGELPGEEGPAADLKVCYADGFVAVLPVQPLGERLRIFYFNPADIYPSWSIPPSYDVSPLRLTPAEKKWMFDVGVYRIPSRAEKKKP